MEPVMSNRVSRATIDAIHLGVAILGWYSATYSPTPDAEDVERSVRLQLDVCGLREVTLPRSKEARRLLLHEVTRRLSMDGKAVLASAVRLGWVLGLYDESSYVEEPDTFHALLQLAAEVGIAEQSIRALIEGRKSIRQADQAEVLVRHIESWMQPAETSDVRSANEYDVFISHASEDKDALARPLYAALVERGLKVWFDEATLELGDSLRRKIDEGLAQCRYGIVILSPRFLRKEWPQRELDGLVARETASGEKAILPIWHDLDEGTLVRYSPMLAGRLAARSEDGVGAVADQIVRVLGRRARMS